MSGDFKQQFAILKSYMESMPAFSPATQKLIELSNDLNASPKDMVKAIRMDPVLTGRVFELVNSAYFNLPEKVTSLNRVVVFIGINTIKNIALAATVSGAVKNNNPALEKIVKPLWQHCLATAVSCKLIGKEVGIERKKLEECFIAGLLHDLGKIILVQAFCNSIPHDGTFDGVKERELYGLDHNDVAFTILKKWNFTDELLSPIKNSHRPSGDDKLGWVIHLADYMTHKLGLNDWDMGEVTTGGTEVELPVETEKEDEVKLPTLDENVWTVLETNSDNIEKALECAADEIKKAELFLSS